MELEIKNVLKQQGFSATKTRIAVLRAILAHQPAAMSQLITALPDVDRATVYRTVDLFVDLGIAKKVSTGFKYRVELGDSFQEHHHHLTCLRCENVIDVHTPEIEYAIEQVAANNGFRPIRHDLEITGYCSSCS
jgi:Fur family transcriptional regulator, ferric uptake regulator